MAERDELVLIRAYGLADTADKRSATPETVYGLASITKAFTSTAVCLAADEGLLDLDTPIPGNHQWTAPTPRQLLQHRGGFPAFYNFHYDTGPLPIDINRYRTLVREPGTDFEYSNIGYHELGGLLEAATGQNLGDYLRERIAGPLGLTSFGYGPAYTGAAPVAQRYSADGRAYATCHSGHPAAGAAGQPPATSRSSPAPPPNCSSPPQSRPCMTPRQSTSTSATVSAGSSRAAPDQ